MRIDSHARLPLQHRTVPFHRPSIGDAEIDAVAATLRSGWLTTGPSVRRFEESFAATVGAPHALAVNSGTAALHLALEAVGVRAGDEVIIPTYTFAATGEVVAYLGARPVLADCRADTFNMDVTTVAPLVGPRTRAIIPVHIAGQACDMAPLMALARERGVAVVEDAAHALGTTYRGRPIGGIGDVTAFSFYATKAITTGEGGMATTANDEYAARMKTMSLHGLSHDAWNRYTDKGHWYYEIVDFGFKYNMTDMAAALGLAQLARATQFAERRRHIAERYTAAFGDLDTCRTPRQTPEDTHAWHLYVLELELPALRGGRNAVVDRLREKGVGTSVHFMPLHLHPAYQKTYGYRPGDLPVAEAVFEAAVSLPIFPAMADEDVEWVIESVRESLSKERR